MTTVEHMYHDVIAVKTDVAEVKKDLAAQHSRLDRFETFGKCLSVTLFTNELPTFIGYVFVYYHRNLKERLFERVCVVYWYSIQ